VLVRELELHHDPGDVAECEVLEVVGWCLAAVAGRPEGWTIRGPILLLEVGERARPLFGQEDGEFAERDGGAVDGGDGRCRGGLRHRVPAVSTRDVDPGDEDRGQRDSHPGEYPGAPERRSLGGTDWGAAVRGWP